MAFEITTPEALAILGRTSGEMRALVARGDLTRFEVRDRKGQLIRRFFHYEEVVALARRLGPRPPDPPRKRGPSRCKPAIGPELLSLTVAERLLDVSQPVLLALINQGQLSVARTSRQGHLHFRREDVIALIEARSAMHSRRPAEGGRTPAGDLVDVPAAALLLNTTPVRVYKLIREGFLQVAHVSADGVRCFRREQVLALKGSFVLKD